MPPSPSFPVVGIGASAGGVDALVAFFRSAPPDAGLAYVIVTHLGPGRESALREILGARTRVPVVTVRDGQTVEPDHVYVLGAAAALSIEQGRLCVRPIEAERRQRHPIDQFFASLAEDRGEHAIGVVLSGGGGDGTIGLKAIKEHGGLAVAQGGDGSSPSHPSMPETAIAAGFIDLILPVEKIAPRLAQYAHGLRMLDQAAEGNGNGKPRAPKAEAPPGTKPVKASRPSAAHAASPQGEGIGRLRPAICDLLRDQTGHDFAGYKERTFLRRVHRRMQVLQIAKGEAYVERLQQDPDEVRKLFRDLLIGVTAFFRDEEAFETLRREVVPRLFEGRGADDVVRAWVPGCSTGEEVYSLAILLREHLDGLRKVPRLQIFATDIDDAALGVARAGRYPAAMLAGHVTPEREHRFFVAEGESRVVAREVRDLCIFSSHSVIRDPPFSRMDLISCRNLLIYLDGTLQKRVIPAFHYALRPGGWLFLGTSESVGPFGEMFTRIDRKHRIFQRRDRPAAIQVPFWPPGPHPNLAAMEGNEAARRGDGGPKPGLAGGIPLRAAAEARVMEHFAPAHVVVNREGDVVHYSAHTGKYLEPAAGAPSRQLLGMARRGLRLELHGALREAIETGRTARRDGLMVELDRHLQPVSLTVEPLGDSASGTDTLYLVVFTDQGPPLAPTEASAQGRNAGRPEPEAGTEHLESELRGLRERLQSTIEEYETALEELKSANEELQSANEELETSKEEMQSVNEELQTVNAELQHKIEDLDRVNADLRNLFDSTRIATVFLDRNLVIRSFTPAVQAVFNLIPSDRGRPLSDITSSLDYPELRENIQEVLRTGQTRERRVGQRGGPRESLLVRLMPYIDVRGQTDGVVVTFVDVTSILEAEGHQRTLVAELNHRVKNTLGVIVSIASATLSPGPERETFVQRLRALARTHDLLSTDRWTTVRLADVVRVEVEPHAADGQERCALDGPELSVPPRIALSFGMVLHELATNAAKYGALSAESGRVAVSWGVGETAGARRLTLTWAETGGPAPGAEGPKRRGFGTRVIEREVRYGLHGTVDLDWHPDGLRVRIDVPLDAATAPVRTPCPKPQAPGPGAAGSPAPRDLASGAEERRAPAGNGEDGGGTA